MKINKIILTIAIIVSILSSISSISIAEETYITTALKGSHPLYPIGSFANSFPNSQKSDYFVISGTNMIFLWDSYGTVIVSSVSLNIVEIQPCKIDKPFVKFAWINNGWLSPASFSTVLPYITRVVICINETNWQKTVILEKP